ncbi:MAG TPA: CoA-binding protein [Terriglobia bacterium]|nr:CoA-binding protein [Terriglobia bacterium]
MPSTDTRQDRAAPPVPYRSRSWSWDRRLAQRGVPLRDPITVMLERYRTVAVVGLSSKLMRPSYGVAAYLQRRGYRILPVNPHESSVLGERAYPSLDDVPEAFEIVLIFRQPRHVPSLVESAIRHGARVVWMQEGVSHAQAAARASAAGLEVVQDRCILKEHAKRFVSEGI